jgi:hypothetical protein
MRSPTVQLNDCAKVLLAATLAHPGVDTCVPWPYRRDGKVPLVYTEHQGGKVYDRGQRGRVYNVGVLVLEATGRPQPSKRHTPGQSCGNPLCIAPAHLFWRPRTVGGAKLTESQRAEIHNSVKPAAELARKYGVSRQLVWQIRRAKQ